MRRPDPKGGGIRLFFDRDIGKRVPNILRSLGVNAVAHDDVYHPNKSIPDMPRLRTWAKRGYVTIQCDRIKDIRRDSAKVATYIQAKARVFLVGGNFTSLETLIALMGGWHEIMRIVASEEGPYIYMVHDNGKIGKRFPPKP